MTNLSIVQGISADSPGRGIIDFDRLSREQAAFAEQWKSARPFEMIVIDDFGDLHEMRKVEQSFPNPESLNKSRDYIFAREKYEKNRFLEINPTMKQLHAELTSDRFQEWLRSVTGLDLFIDPDFHGGGLHSGGPGSFLDMHADFNIHPLQQRWLRELNILLYLNPGWQREWGGSLKLRHAETGETAEIEPLFNRCVIMLTKEHTLHGYDPISFPDGRFRRSVAAYAYSLMPEGVAVQARSTVWKSERSRFRRMVGPVALRLVAVKNRFFGNGSIKNR